MNNSSRFAVAVHITSVLAAHESLGGGKRAVTSALLSKSVNTNPVVIRRIIGALQDAGIVVSHTGPAGGSRLKRAAGDINLHDVYLAVENGELFHLHYQDPNHDCPIGAHIQNVLLSVMQDAAAALRDTLSRITLADIAADIARRSGLEKLLEGGMSWNELESRYVFKDGRYQSREEAPQKTISRTPGSG